MKKIIIITIFVPCLVFAADPGFEVKHTAHGTEYVYVHKKLNKEESQKTAEPSAELKKLLQSAADILTPSSDELDALADQTVALVMAGKSTEAYKMQQTADAKRAANAVILLEKCAKDAAFIEQLSTKDRSNLFAEIGCICQLVPDDHAKAKQYLSMAAELGDQRAKSRLQMLNSKYGCKVSAVS